MLPTVRHVFHPTDFSSASEAAFHHALAIAVSRRADLTIMNVGKARRRLPWRSFPAVRQTLERWGRLPPSSDRSAVRELLGVQIKKVAARGPDPATSILEFLAAHPADLMVLAMSGRAGLARLKQGSVAETLARASRVTTMLVPAASRGFVAAEDGSVSLERILVPVAAEPEPERAVQAATWVAAELAAPSAELHLLHVGTQMPAIDLPEGCWRFEASLRQGDVVSEILQAGAELAPDLMVMASDGRDGLLDLVRGSHTERVVRGAHCPVMSVLVVKEWAVAPNVSIHSV